MFTQGDRKVYDEKMAQYVYGKDDCPFCHEASHSTQIVWKGKYWFVLHNLYPYSGDTDHLMAIPFGHKKFSFELTHDEINELSEIYTFMKQYFGEKQYFSCTRETMSNRSVEHYHMHFIPGKLQGKFLRKMLEGQGFPIVEDLKIE